METKIKRSGRLQKGGTRICLRLILILAFWCLFSSWTAQAVGTWTPLVNQAPGAIVNSVMLLLPDGRIMACDDGAFGGGKSWCCLTPDIHGSYINGTWSTLASMHASRGAFASQVLTSGQVFVAGGEQGTRFGSAEVYDPILDCWTLCPGTGAGFSDMLSVLLPNGNVFVQPVRSTTCGQSLIYNPTSNSWLTGPILSFGCDLDEATWVKLPDYSILVPYDIPTERYIPSLNQWVNDASTPVPLYGGVETGAAFLLANTNVIFLGCAGYTALYKPSGTTNMGTWAVGPAVPNNQEPWDAPAAMMVNGKILCMFSPISNPGSSSYFYEYDPVANAFAVAGAPDSLTNIYIQGARMLVLPAGGVLFSPNASPLYEYQPDGSPLAAGQPTIISITNNSYRSYHLTGKLLNGISQGAAYGDDSQMDSNYPLVRMTNNANGNV